jgi:hypothetical protein
LIVAGGSASSTELPEDGFNCYNSIRVKWNPEAMQGRIMLWTKLSPPDFFRAVSEMIKSSDGVITVLVDADQSGPVEATIASSVRKPQCIVDGSSGAVRLLKGLPGITEVSKIATADLEAQVRGTVERFLKTLNSRKAEF